MIDDQREQWNQERGERLNLKNETAREINKQKKEVSRQLEKEQEFRIGLEHKLQTSEDTLKRKKTTISKLNTNIRTLQTQLENEEKKYQDCLNEQKNLRRKCKDATNSEQKANEELKECQSQLKDERQRLERITEQNEKLRESMRKKDTKLRELKAKEDEITKNLNDAENKNREAQKKLSKVKKFQDQVQERRLQGNRSSRSGGNSKKKSFLQRNDPFHQYRKLSNITFLNSPTNVHMKQLVFVLHCFFLML